MYPRLSGECNVRDETVSMHGHSPPYGKEIGSPGDETGGSFSNAVSFLPAIMVFIPSSLSKNKVEKCPDKNPGTERKDRYQECHLPANLPVKDRYR